MKKTITTILCLVIMISMYAQNKSIGYQPKGMVFIPQGQFEMNITGNAQTMKARRSVDAFWMSNEITNSEYMEFVNWAKKNPDKKIYQLKSSVEIYSDPNKGRMKDTVIVKMIPIEVSSFNSDMIDPLCLEKVNKDYKGYFTDPRYNDFPVVGVSFKMAEYYCFWKTMIENEQRKEKGLPPIQFYRIPLETEWEYVAQQPLSDKSNIASIQALQKVSDGKVNDWGLYHFSDNVSEWVKSNSDQSAVVRGGSWKSGNDYSERQVIDPDSKEPYIGFRIVQSYMYLQK